MTRLWWNLAKSASEEARERSLLLPVTIFVNYAHSKITQRLCWLNCWLNDYKLSINGTTTAWSKQKKKTENNLYYAIKNQIVFFTKAFVLRQRFVFDQNREKINETVKLTQIQFNFHVQTRECAIQSHSKFLSLIRMQSPTTHKIMLFHWMNFAFFSFCRFCCCCVTS